jgi:hypothetical protein
MNSKLAPLVACLLLLVLGVTARADIIYSFTTTTPAPNAGTITGAFSVPDNAITKGSLQSSDIDAYLFTESGTNPPFFSFIWSPTLGNQFASTNRPVNPVTGVFAPPFNDISTDIAFLHPPFGPSLLFIPTGPNTANFEIVSGLNAETGSGTFTISGPGQPPVQDAKVPEPSTLALLALGGGALAGWRRWRKRATA